MIHHVGSSGRTGVMTSASLTATIRLGVMLSVVAAGLAAGLSLIGEVSQWSYVLTVAAVGFTTSWIQSGRVARDDRPLPVLLAHRSPHRALG
jgi:hypothetical protein